MIRDPFGSDASTIDYLDQLRNLRAPGVPNIVR